ncbi:MAG: hypothetical protein JXA73_06170 [Acidobacteria bacterium]|nr:hypothetical protein [Acidobacteriota bacterium]
MARKPQQQTLSIRVSEALRDFLERSKQVISSGRGESVSTSDVAKILLESAKDDRLDFRLEAAKLQHSSTESLWNIRRKWDQKRDLSRAEWIFLSQYIQVACEELSENPEMPTSESFAVLLEALLAIRSLRVERGVGLDRFYLENIGFEDESTFFNNRQLDPDIVPRVANKWAQHLRTSSNSRKPTYAGRAFYVAIRDEELPDLVSINKMLFPFMDTLLRLAARGHWIREHQPVRGAGQAQHIVEEIPSVSSAGFRLSFAVGSDGEVSILLQIAERDLMYPLGPYPEIREFVAVLEHLRADKPWRGLHFYAYTNQETSGSALKFYFRRHKDGVTLGLSSQEWHSLKGLFAKAMKMPALQRLFEELSFVYGEL